MSLLKDAQAISVKSDFEAFDLVCRHLISQRAKCFGPFGDCAYRGVDVDQNAFSEELYNYTDFDSYNGYACAVGVLIKDKFYDTNLEGNTVHYDETENALCNSHPEWIITDDTKVMLDNLQTIHDSKDVELWPAYFLFMSDYFSINRYHWALDSSRFSDRVSNREKYDINGVDISLITSGSFEADAEKLFVILDEMKGVKR